MSLHGYSLYQMTKTITGIGNSQGVIFDAALMDLARLKVGDQLTVSVHEDGAIVLTPVRPVINAPQATEVSKRLIRKNSELFRRLS